MVEDTEAQTEGAGTSGEGDEQSPEYATKSDIQAITEAVNSLKEQIDGRATESQLDPTDQGVIDRLYDELTRDDSSVDSTGEPDDAVAKRLDGFETVLKKQNAFLEQQYRASQREKINTRFAGKYDDWTENEEAIWKVAGKHPTLSGDEVYVMWKLETQGADALTVKEKKVAIDAAKTSGEAKAAASEKPGSPAATKDKEFDGDLTQLLKETYEAMPQKPEFK